MVLLVGGCQSDTPDAPATSDAPAASDTSAAVRAAPLPDSIRLPNGRQVLDGVFAGGQPTPAQLRSAQAYGVRTVVNLRPDSEASGFDERALVRELGMAYVSIPVTGAPDVTRETAQALQRVLADPANRPLLIHCSSGNRVGALFAARAHLLDGMAPDTALQIGTRAGLTRLEAPLRSRWTAAE